MADDYSSDASTTGRLALYGSVAGRIDTAGDRDWFQMDLDSSVGYNFALVPGPGSPAGQRLDLTVFPSTGYTGMAIYSTELDFYKSAPLGEPVAPYQTGRYYVQVKGSQVGDYTLSVTPVADDIANSRASALAFNAAGQASGRLDYLYDRDYFKFAAQQGVTYKIKLNVTAEQQLLAAGARPALAVVDKDGQTSGNWNPDNGTLTFLGSSSDGYNYIRIETGSFATLPQGEKLNYSLSMTMTDTIAPRVSNGAGAVDGPLILTFDEPVRAGTGVISLLDSSGTVLETFDMQQAGRVTVSGSAVTMQPSHVLFPASYTLKMSAGSVVDLAGNAASTATISGMDVSTLASKGAVQGGRLANTTYSGTQGERDTIVYKGSVGDYSIYSAFGPGKFLISKAGVGADTLSNIDRIFFTGSSDVVALSMDGDVGRAFRLYRAALDRAPDKAGLGYWISVLEHGTKLGDVAQGFIGSAEFQQHYGANPGNAAFVDGLYRNVLHREGDAGGVSYWNTVLEHGASRADVLTSFSESAENMSAAVALVGNGFVYTSYGA
ncbi:DUF4214 domain-containing protein [Pseudoduganella aquatica]|uniref:DUF4214 domain-containing protein n=1 Tax=Pseudoduganella aquatica TaxID=2660641 RepID=A0A7X4HBH0_9BURK|nr:DUF4214 domain-containing protein [Pseudoduganella aquatica]MYN08193.1 DUF4214 domain-containing protein [Pseudoduganella aquatica]